MISWLMPKWPIFLNSTDFDGIMHCAAYTRIVFGKYGICSCSMNWKMKLHIIKVESEENPTLEDSVSPFHLKYWATNSGIENIHTSFTSIPTANECTALLISGYFFKMLAKIFKIMLKKWDALISQDFYCTMLILGSENHESVVAAEALQYWIRIL